MVRALVVDDEPHARERIRTLLARHPDVEVIGECESGDDAVRAILEDRPDLVLLDVQMPGLTGFEVLAAVAADYLPTIVFVTAYDAYALQAFDVNAVDYVLKPINPARFAAAVARARARLADRSGGDERERLQSLAAHVSSHAGGLGPLLRFVVRTGSKVSFVRADDVDWIDAADNYVRLHVGGRAHLVRGTMKTTEDRLDPDVFVRIHRSVIVNLERVASVEPYARGEYLVTMADGTRLVSSRAFSARLRAMIK